MSTWDKSSHYYSGQGVVLLGSRDAAGKPVKLLPVGNVSSLKTTIATTVVEHYEAQSGNRGLDLRNRTKITATLSMVMENYNAANLALALNGDNTVVPGAALTGEAIKWWNGAVIPLAHISVSSLAVKRGSQALTLYVDAVTPYDYKLNAASGSIQFNDGAILKTDKLTFGGTAPTVITVGATTSVTVANTAVVGDDVIFTGFTGADAALINGIAFQVVTASPTVVTINLNSSSKTITLGTPISIFEGQALTVDYTYTGQFLVDALTEAPQDFYMRFEGLNTAENQQPVVVEVFRFSSDPLKELDLISDVIQQFSLDGSVLADALQTTGSKYFKVTKLV